MTLTEFLLARITTDEVVARSVSLDPRGVAKQNFGRAGRMQWFALTLDRPWGDGIARVLAECAAKRRIVTDITDGCPHPPRVGGWCADCDKTLRILATVYADHPDYRSEWRP